MTTVMTRTACERFLSEVRVGVLSVADPTEPGGTLAVPIWYDYTPEHGVWVITKPASPKGRALEATGRYGIAVQDEQLPYRYVSVEGPVTEVRPLDIDRDLLPLSVRYFGDELGARYTAQLAEAEGEADEYRVYVMRPERWASADMTGAFDALQTPAGTAP